MSQQLTITLSEEATSRYLKICESLNEESNDIRLVVDIATPNYIPHVVSVDGKEIGEASVDFMNSNTRESQYEE